MDWERKKCFLVDLFLNWQMIISTLRIQKLKIGHWKSGPPKWSLQLHLIDLSPFPYNVKFSNSIFSKSANLPILSFWILNLHIIICQFQKRSTVKHFFLSLHAPATSVYSLTKWYNRKDVPKCKLHYCTYIRVMSRKCWDQWNKQASGGNFGNIHSVTISSGLPQIL